MSTSSKWWFQNLFGGGNNHDHNEPPPPPPTQQQQQQNTTATKDDLDSLLASSMKQLSVDQREAVLEEIHGITQSITEDPIQMNIWLTELDQHLQSIKYDTVYEMAEIMDKSSYVTSIKFRIMFLRATRYNPIEAATRIVSFLNVKRDIFGLSKLTTKITLKDLNEHDKHCLLDGSFILLKQRDTSGRPIVLMKNKIATENDMKARYYFLMSLIESSDEIQKSGFVFIFLGFIHHTNSNNNSNNNNNNNIDMNIDIDDGENEQRQRQRQPPPRKRVGQPGLLWSTIPLHHAAIHLCFDSVTTYIVQSFALYRLPQSVRPRIRIHYVSSNERCQEVLLQFGIPKNTIPTTNSSSSNVSSSSSSSNNMNNNHNYNCNDDNSHPHPMMDHHFAWYGQRQTIEEEEASSSIITASKAGITTNINNEVGGYNQNDVLFGYYATNHSGNIQLRKLVQQFSKIYDSSKEKKTKVEITEYIIQKIHHNGGRFLKRQQQKQQKQQKQQQQDGSSSSRNINEQQQEQWIEVSYKEAREKVAHTFRNLRRGSRGRSDRSSIRKETKNLN